MVIRANKSDQGYIKKFDVLSQQKDTTLYREEVEGVI